MSTTTSEIQITLTYTDYTTRKYSMNYNGYEIASIKSAVSSFNQKAADNTSAVYKTFVSNNSAPVASINNVAIVTKGEEVIYNG